MYEVTDDSGFLALFDPYAYQSHIREDLDIDALTDHFKAEMYHQHLLLWGTGCENIWNVDVRFEATKERGFREINGPIMASGNHLCLTNLESLTMAADYPDISLPQPDQYNLMIGITPGLYECRIVQRLEIDAENGCGQEEGVPGFIVELVAGEHPRESWRDIPWSDNYQ